MEKAQTKLLIPGLRPFYDELLGKKNGARL